VFCGVLRFSGRPFFPGPTRYADILTQSTKPVSLCKKFHSGRLTGSSFAVYRFTFDSAVLSESFFRPHTSTPEIDPEKDQYTSSHAACRMSCVIISPELIEELNVSMEQLYSGCKNKLWGDWRKSSCLRIFRHILLNCRGLCDSIPWWLSWLNFWRMKKLGRNYNSFYTFTAKLQAMFRKNTANVWSGLNWVTWQL
jgi:hypothetical protein